MKVAGSAALDREQRLVPFSGRVLLYLFVASVLGFLILPTFIVVPLSFSDSVYLQFPPQGFTWRWYQDYIGIEGASTYGAAGQWIPATLVSLQLAVLVVALAVPIGAFAAYGLSRGSFAGKPVLNAVIILPLVMPSLVTGIALYFFFSRPGLRWLLQPLPHLALSAWAEWVIVIAIFLLGLCAAACLFFRSFQRNDLADVLLQFRPWAPAILGLAGAFFLVAFVAGATDEVPGGLFAAGDPIPPFPTVSPALLIAHTLLAIPYVVIILTAAMRGIDVTLDRAAAVLGASPLKGFLRVLLPCMIPAIASSALFCFLISWDELLIALFLSTSEVVTLPKRMWDGIRMEISPTIAAISTLLLFLTTTLLAAGYFARRRNGADDRSS